MAVGSAARPVEVTCSCPVKLVQAMIRGLNRGSIGIPQGQTRGGQATVVERAGGVLYSYVCVCVVRMASGRPSALALALPLRARKWSSVSVV